MANGKKKVNELVVPETVPVVIPDYLKQGKGRGLENVDREDLILPRIKLLQSGSPEVKEGGLQEGTMINSLSKKQYGDKLVFIPILHFKSQILWQDREEGGGILCSSNNAKDARGIEAAQAKAQELGASPLFEGCIDCPLQEWNNDAKREKDKAPACTLNHNFPILIEGDTVPAALSMDRSKISVAKRLLSLAKYMGDNVDMFAGKYKLGVVKEINKRTKDIFYNYTIELAGFVTEDEYKRAEQLYKSLAEKSITVHAENETEPVEG